MLEAVYDRVICSVDMNYKNRHRFENGFEIGLRRDVDEFDRRITQPVNGIVMACDKIPVGAEVLLNHNATHDTHKLFGYKGIDGSAIASDTQYFSIPPHDVYGWRIGADKWKPLFPYEFGLRIFKPYGGAIKSIPPTLIAQKLFITTGAFEGKVVMTRPNSDYEIIFNNENGQEEKLIRVRHFGEIEDFRQQILSIDKYSTEQVLNGNLLVGYNVNDAKKIE